MVSGTSIFEKAIEFLLFMASGLNFQRAFVGAHVLYYISKKNAGTLL